MALKPTFPFFGKAQAALESRKQNPAHTYQKTYGPSQYGPMIAAALGGGTLSASEIMKLYRESGALSTAVDMIAKAVQSIPPAVKTASGDFIDDDPMLELLTQPNGFDTWKQFIGDLARYKLLTNDGFVYSAGTTTQPPLAIHAISNQLVQPTANSQDGYPQMFRISNPSPGSDNYVRDEANFKDIRFFASPLKELYHIRGFSSRTTKLLADSPVESIFSDIQQLIQGNAHNVSLLENGGTLSLVFTFKDSPSDDEFESRLRSVRDQRAGPTNAGSIMAISAQNMEITEYGTNNKDMDFNELMRRADTKVYLRYGIPLPLVDPENQTYNNYDRALEAFWDDAVLPLIDTLFAGLTRMLAPRYGFNPNEKSLSYNPEAIKVLRTQMLDELRMRSEINIETLNEKRQLLPNRDDLPGGDEFLIPATLIPLDQADVDIPSDEDAESMV